MKEKGENDDDDGVFWQKIMIYRGGEMRGMTTDFVVDDDGKTKKKMSNKIPSEKVDKQSLKKQKTKLKNMKNIWNKSCLVVRQ